MSGDAYSVGLELCWIGVEARPGPRRGLGVLVSSRSGRRGLPLVGSDIAATFQETVGCNVGLREA